MTRAPGEAEAEAAAPRTHGVGRRPRALLVQDADVRHYPPMYNAAEILAERGFAVEIVHRRSEDEDGPYPRGATIHAPAARGGSAMRELRLVCRAVRVARHFKPDVIIGYDFRGAVAAAITRTLVSLLGRRPALVYHNHDAIDWSSGSRLRRPGKRLESHIARAADLVVLPDQERAAWYAAEHRLPTLPLTQWNCPRLRRESRTNVLRELLRARGYQFNRIVIRQQANIGPGHAIEATVRSIPRWPPDAGLVLVGSVSAKYRAQLMTLAAAAGVAERVAIVPRVPYERVFALVSGADVGLALYDPVDVNRRTNAGASNKLFEYAAAGLPIIASDFAGFVSVVEGNRVGLCVSPGSPEEIADAVNSLLGTQGIDAAATSARLHREAWNYDAQIAPAIEKISALINESRSKGGRS